MLAELFDERRRHQRILVDMPLAVVQHDARGNVCFQTSGKVLNMSTGGLRAVLSDAVPTHQPIWLSIRMPGRQLKIAAQPVRVQSLEAHLHYVSLEFDRSCIDALLQIARLVCSGLQPEAPVRRDSASA
jgi:hypothetical protein